jgi:cytoskeletal protein CcmA (bactofilin family)
MMNPGEGTPAVIGKSVKIVGELTGSEDLYLDGEIEGTIVLTESRFTVGPNATVLADVEARDVIVFGRVEGNIHSHGRVELRQGSSVAGDIHSLRLSIEEGASISGKVETGGKGETAPTQSASPTGKAVIPVAVYPPTRQAATDEKPEQPNLYPPKY